MSPVVSVLEAIRFRVRPGVLVIRPLVKLCLGLEGMHFMLTGSFSVIYFYLLVAGWFFYETFVCVVQWYIVYLVLMFTGEM